MTITKPLLFILSLFTILFSKEFLVFNEETLIVVAFSIFIYLVLNKASSMISEELDNKSKEIQNKFNLYKNIQEKTILYLFNYYSKREILSEKIQKISNIKKLRISVINDYFQVNLKKQLLVQLEDVLNRFVLNEYSSTSTFQRSFVSKLSNVKTKLRNKIN